MSGNAAFARSDAWELSGDGVAAGLTLAEISVLAGLVVDQVEARQLLAAAGYPVGRIPMGTPNMVTFWTAVSDELAGGVVVDGRARLLGVLRRRYPANPAFGGPVRGTPAARGRPQAGPVRPVTPTAPPPVGPMPGPFPPAGPMPALLPPTVRPPLDGVELRPRRAAELVMASLTSLLAFASSWYFLYSGEQAPWPEDSTNPPWQFFVELLCLAISLGGLVWLASVVSRRTLVIYQRGVMLSGGGRGNRTFDVQWDMARDFRIERGKLLVGPKDQATRRRMQWRGGLRKDAETGMLTLCGLRRYGKDAPALVEQALLHYHVRRPAG
jgi:hypothetical protein